jgi:hypothetical protein
MTGRQWVELFAGELGVKPKISVMSKALLTVLGVFTPVLREFKELSYQWDPEYFIDSSKFEKCFGFKPTTYQEGARQVVLAVWN